MEALRARHLLRVPRFLDGPGGTEVSLGGRRLLNFSSNDYLGLASEPVLREAAKMAVEEFGVGSGSSRLVCGGLPPHRALEAAIARFKRTEAAVAFANGYATAVGVLPALCGRGDVIVLDKLVHASLVDGARLSGAAIRVFPHNHMGKLESHLAWARSEYPEGRVLVVTESVFSMDGDRAPLREIVEIKERFGALLLVDEAHAVGVIGPYGRGLVDRLGVGHRTDFQMGTLGKALGVAGGYIAGKSDAIGWLVNRARSFVYSTAPPPAQAAAAAAAIALMESPDGEKRRLKLLENVRHFAGILPERLRPEGLVQSAIIPLHLGAEQLALAASRWLRRAGIFVPAIRYPTVARGAARLRVTLSAEHSGAQLDRFAVALHRLSERLRARGVERVSEVR